MLFAHSRDDSYFGVDEIAYFFDVANLLGAHFDNEYFVVRFHLLAHGAHHAHWRVETAGGHQHVVAFAKDAVEVVFRACFPIAAGDADNF